jgi:hypothetical protein
MRRTAIRIGAVAASVVATVAVAASPAYALSYRCKGECTTDWVWANQTGRYVNARVQNPYSAIDPRWCSWNVRDYDNGKIVASGHVFDDEEDDVHVTGLYGRYKLYVSNSACWGQISDQPW